MEPVREIRVLIADDDEDVREALAELLGAEEHFRVVAIARDAPEAIARARELLPDVAVLDVNMPGGGPRAAREIRRASPSTRVMALSAAQDRATVSEMLLSGAVGYVVKGANARQVTEAIEQAAAGRGSLSAEVTLEVIQELVEARDRAADLAAELETLDETKRRIIGILSHELFTPITVIQGVARTLATMGSETGPGDLEGLASSVARASERLRRLVVNIDTAAHLDRNDAGRLKLQPTTIGDLLETSLSEFQRQRDRIDLHIDAQLRPRTWPLDPDLARRALVSVIENALALSEDAPVDITVSGDGERLVVGVSDRGPGVPPEMRKVIFEPLRQGDESDTRVHQGLGLGLYLARRILIAHGGDIEVVPRDGGGTTFQLRFGQSS